jgi:hypothetical protein
MHCATRVAALVLAAAALLAIPAVGAAAGSSHLIYKSSLSSGSHVSCKKTGITGPTGAVMVSVYALKGKHPAKSALSCSRGIAIVKAGKADLFSKLSKSLGKKFRAQSATYTLEGFVGQGASGVAPAFIGANTAVIASFASGR